MGYQSIEQGMRGVGIGSLPMYFIISQNERLVKTDKNNFQDKQEVIVT